MLKFHKMFQGQKPNKRNLKLNLQSPADLVDYLNKLKETKELKPN